MKNKLFQIAFAISIVLFSACNNADKVKTTPAVPQGSSTKKIINAQLTPGQMHNQILEAYLQQYGIAPDNQITVAEVETMCDQIAQIAMDQGLSGNMSAADLGDQMFNSYVSSGSFVNGVLRPTDELITMTINEVSNLDIRDAYTQIHNMALQDNPNFIQNATLILDGLNGLSQADQQEVTAFKSVLLSSYDFWTNPSTPTPTPSYLPTGAGLSDLVALADAAGFRRGYGDVLAGGGSLGDAIEGGATRGGASSAAAAR